MARNRVPHTPFLRVGILVCLGAVVFVAFLSGCKAKTDSPNAAPGTPPFMSAITTAAPQTPIDALPADKTGGFDGARAFNHIAKQVAFGPHPAGSPAILEVQNYLASELKSYGCTVDADSFSSDTPAGRLPMKNLLVKIPGEKPGIIMLATHYDTKRIPNFVGADDAGSSTAVMLELARLLCPQRGKYAVWIAFFDGEEAVNLQWVDPDNRYGSREMAARLATSGDLSKVRAFLLADIVGGKTPHFKRDTDSAKWLVDLVWGVAKKLGYGDIFLDQPFPVEDDHQSFATRHVPVVDVIDLDTTDVPYWHTTKDTLDKISAQTLGITGHVFLESIKALQSK
jgi:hypothetical protein